MERGEGMLAEFAERRRGIEDDMAAKAKATVTRKVNPLRAALAEGLLALAKELNETSGKWMLFPSPADVDRIWATVCQGVLDGKLGPAAKVATADDVGLEGGGERGRLVCVYTADFSDIKDVKRVLLSLKEMGLVDRKGAYGQDVGIWYKCGRCLSFPFISPLRGEMANANHPRPVGGGKWDGRAEIKQEACKARAIEPKKPGN